MRFVAHWSSFNFIFLQINTFEQMIIADWQFEFQSFSTNGQPTIEFKDQSLDFLADSATGLMFYDIKDITDGYDCTSNVSSEN